MPTGRIYSGWPIFSTLPEHCGEMRTSAGSGQGCAGIQDEAEPASGAELDASAADVDRAVTMLGG